MDELRKWPPGVGDKLKTYVYRLIDPRNDETFYVGKGQGNRVFAHIRAEIDGDGFNEKLKRIREIRAAGFDVKHVIHRHGMDDKTACEVEAALIDAYPNLTNAVGGMGSSDFGTIDAKGLSRRYCAEPAQFQHKVLILKIPHNRNRSLYDTTRFAWTLNPRKAEQADVIVASRRGLIVAAFIAESWLEATAANFPGRETELERWGFIGHEAPPELQSLYVGKSLPAAYRQRGAASPIRYTW